MKSKLIYAGSVVFGILLCMHAEETTAAAKEALLLCGNTVIPSLFPFFVLSSFMVNTGFVAAAGKLLAPLAKLLFKVSGSGAVVFVMGLLCGYPTGAKMVAELFEKKQIERAEAQRLLPFCNNSGPLFVIGAVGSGMLGSTALGLKLYAIHALSAAATGFLLSLFSKAQPGRNQETVIFVNLGTAFSDAVCRSVTTMLNVCGFILFFSVIRAFLLPYLGTDILSLLLGGMAEVTLGAANIAAAGKPFAETVILLSAVIGFGGVCVLLQVWGVVSRAGLSIKSYFFGKLLQMGIAAGFAALVARHSHAVPAFAELAQPARAPSLLLFLAACAYTLFRLIKLTNRS